MKSIVLCENTLINHQGDTKSLKEAGNDKQVEGKVKLNGTTDNEKSELKVPDCNSEKSEDILHNGKNEAIDDTSITEVSENDEVKSTKESDSSEKCEPSDEKNMSVTLGTADILCDDKSENCLKGTKNSLDVSENVSENVPSDLQDNKSIKCGTIDSVNEVCKEVSEVSILEDSEEITEEVAINSTKKDVDNATLSEDLSKTKVEIFDVDSNKENEKDEKTNSVEDLHKESAEEDSSLEIQVEKVQSFSSQESDFIWLPSDSEKSQQDVEEVSHEKETEESEDVSACVEESQKSSEEEEEKEADCHSLEIIDGESSENIENEELQMEVEEVDQGLEINEENKNDQAEWVESCEERETKKTEEEAVVSLTVSKKRRMADKKDGDPSAKKQKLSESQRLEDGTDGTKGPESPELLDTKGESSKVGEPFFEGEVSEEKVSDEGKTENAKESYKEGESEKESTALSSSFLDSFRGSLKNLTRSDLEELIVQKLCEVITERSTVGELRRKAQALEQDQERWKVKVQGLTKQMKEMEMVMKKYMSEVQKQLKDGTVQATPLRVTRSVGLQVSFYAYANKGSKSNGSPPAPQTTPTPTTPTAQAPPGNPCPVPTINTRSAKGSPKPPPQYTPISQNLRSKSMPTSSKPPPTVQKPPAPPQRRHSVAPNSTPPNRTTTIATIPINNRPIQTQVSGSRPGYKTLSNGPQQLVQHQQQPPQLQQQQQQQQQQHGSKVIDLTDDDDQRINNSGKPNTTTRVVSHLPQPGAPPNSRYAYLLPATSTSTGPVGGQNRQVLIATPTIQTPQQGRQIMCSMPPLLFKGGNQVQSAPQPQVISQNSSRVFIPKTLRHPAPLPQAPIRNWANMKQLPPRPALKISKVQTGIVLSWNMVLGPEHAPIRSYQLYAYQESNTPPTTSLWKKVGDVKALPLPMACTLTQFMSGHKYHFAVRAVDLHSRIGPFSFPGTIVLDKGR